MQTSDPAIEAQLKKEYHDSEEAVTRAAETCQAARTALRAADSALYAAMTRRNTALKRLGEYRLAQKVEAA